MSSFICKVEPITILQHPNADLLELARVGDYISVVKKGMFNTGDLVVYIPEQTMVPNWILKEQNLWDEEKNKGVLAGPEGNRVKPTRLRGITSYGLVHPLIKIGTKHFLKISDGSIVDVNENDDVGSLLGLTKWEAPVPVALSGECLNLEPHTLKFDIENFKRFPKTIEEGTEVYISDKIHGSWICVAYIPTINHPELLEGKYFCTSKGLSEKGLALKYYGQKIIPPSWFHRKYNKFIKVVNAVLRELEINKYYKQLPVKYEDKFSRVNEKNSYVNIMNQYRDHVLSLYEYFKGDSSVYLLGEIYGPIQDLKYGSADEVKFAAFDIYVGRPGTGRYIDKMDFYNICKELHIPTVPLLYIGPFSVQKLKELTDGKEQVSGKELHIKEGAVVNLAIEDKDPKLGRIILKSVSEAYLNRKNATEYN